MNLLRSSLLLMALFTSLFSFSQQGFLFVKKGFHKKRVYTEGDIIQLKLEDGSYRKGVITLLRNDTIFINEQPVYRPLVAEVILERKPNKSLPDVKTMLLIGAGVALSTAGLTLSKQTDFKTAAAASLIIGYGPLLLKHFGGVLMHAFIRTKFKVGRKFHLQVLDFHIPPTRLKSF